jgi:hypothetical protein
MKNESKKGKTMRFSLMFMTLALNLHILQIYVLLRFLPIEHKARTKVCPFDITKISTCDSPVIF